LKIHHRTTLVGLVHSIFRFRPTAQQAAGVPTLDRRPNRPVFHHLGPNPRVIADVRSNNFRSNNAAVVTDDDHDDDDDDDADRMERRGGPNRRPNQVRTALECFVLTNFVRNWDLLIFVYFLIALPLSHSGSPFFRKNSFLQCVCVGNNSFCSGFLGARYFVLKGFVRKLLWCKIFCPKRFVRKHVILGLGLKGSFKNVFCAYG
jgi:hypothetical protein